MENVVERPRQIDVARDVVVDELEIGPGTQMRDVVEIARQQVVHGDDAMAFGEEPVAEVGAEKAGAAGDQGRGLSGRDCIHGRRECHVIRV